MKFKRYYGILCLVGGLEHEFYFLYVYIYILYIGNVIIPTDFHIFQRSRSTTNQMFFCSVYGMSSHIISNISSDIGCKLKNRLDHDSIAFLFIYRPGIS